MTYKLTSTVVALGTGLALVGCASDVEDTSTDPDALVSDATDAEDVQSEDESENLGETSDALRGGGRGGGGGHHGGGGHGGWSRGGGGHHGGGWAHPGGGHRGGSWGGGRYVGGWRGGLPGGRWGGYHGRLVRGHYGYGRGGVVVIGDPVYVGVPTAYYGWIRNVDAELQCQSINWSGPECSFVTDTAACVPGVGCFVRPF